MSTPSLIYIAGVSPRSGTNYLNRLVSKHPSCVTIADGEDHFLSKSTLLRLFAERVYNHWNEDWAIKKENASGEVLGAIGEGLVGFLRSQATDEDGSAADADFHTVVTKTPHAKNARLFPRLFHDGFLIVLIRDGRAVTESRMKTFEQSFDAAVRGWRRGARDVIRLVEEHGWSSEWHCTVKYEDVFRQPDDELRQLFDAVSLDPSLYPYSYLEDVAVVGSSTYGREGEAVTWEEKQADGAFDPLSRFRDWGDEKHERFEWLAGDELREMGYAPARSAAPASPIRHHLLDAKQMPKIAKRTVRAKVRDLIFSHVMG